jgi:hypothetical protein
VIGASSVAWATALAVLFGSSSTPDVEPHELQDPRESAGPDAVAWSAEDDVDREAAADAAPTAPAAEETAAPAKPPPPRYVSSEETIEVAVGLSPDAVGNKREQDLLARLEANAKASVGPKTKVRRVRPGMGTPREICRRHRDDLVVLIGYVPDREEPVVLAHDCRLDQALGLRAVTSVDEAALIAVLWDEHDELVRSGVRERRRRRPMGQKARIALGAGVALVVVGVAVGALIANALRDETVVLKVGP